MKTLFPQVGSQVEVVLGGDKGTEHILAEVMDETEGGLILASFDAADDFTLPGINTPLKVRFHLRDAGYEFESIILQQKQSPHRMAFIAKPRQVIRRQLRAYLRVDCRIPVSIIRRDDKKRNVLGGTITNISGGGMLIEMKVAIPPEVLIELKFDLGESGQTISSISARIVNIREGQDGQKIYVLQYEGMDEEQRMAIIRFTFQLQRKAAKSEPAEAGKS
ncbi:MAG: PilZ domain-containing protein [Candidatus Hydrogenedentota bacterium]